ncbi:30S ribosomal protein S13 [Candidatus Nanohalobium constans]|uniref:Small ribosomal subunit protein uS13 n=1 Tax=Candidatus Nanohalobium constans TaxID=2565781 RepID=A0A5Q0UH82_9ARCH|nr:30S ribosomal protein S13 [Candidatus Nanohalobium constans]QGA80946.1 30S ribosomal protein S13 [Candidatus Nanohalobium constans]
MSETKEIVRIARTGIDGTKPVGKAITALSGVGDMYANAVAEKLGYNQEKIGDLSDEKIDEIEEAIKNPDQIEVPEWLRNRRKDRETGENGHLIESDLELKEEFDIRRLKQTGTYRGWRHKIGLPVRGQKTKSSFRSGSKVGVDTASIKEEASAGGDGDDE